MSSDALHGGGRREFLGQVVAVVGTGAAALAIPSTLAASTLASDAADDRWLDKLKGKYRQVFDAYKPDDGFGLAYAMTFLNTQGENPDAGAVVVLRHSAMPLAMTHDVWARYKIGEAIGLRDPETKAPAIKNPFLRPKSGLLLSDDMAIDRLLARGVVFGACGVALKVLSGALAPNAGVTPAQAEKEWQAAMIPGIPVLPSGVWGVNRAQMAGCTYCAAA